MEDFSESMPKFRALVASFLTSYPGPVIKVDEVSIVETKQGGINIRFPSKVTVMDCAALSDSIMLAAREIPDVGDIHIGTTNVFGIGEHKELGYSSTTLSPKAFAAALEENVAMQGKVMEKIALVRVGRTPGR